MKLRVCAASTFGLLAFWFLLLTSFSAVHAGAARRAATEPTAASTAPTRATVLRGRASWYGREHQGRRTSSGERFNRHAYTCAHKTLPFGTRLRVTNPRTGKAVVVRVTDRGPFRHQRILDLAEVAARPLGIIERGAIGVIAEVVPVTTPLGPTGAPANLLALQAADPNPDAAFTTYEVAGAEPVAAETAASAPAVAPAAAPVATTSAETPPRFVVQAGTFADPQNARVMQAKIQSLDQTLQVALREENVEGRLLNRVLVEQLDNRPAAEAIRRRLQFWGIAGLVRQAP